MVTSDFLFDPAERRMSSRLVSLCPRCGAEVEDLDGFGVLIHDACGFCSHPDAYGGKCRSCEAVV